MVDLKIHALQIRDAVILVKPRRVIELLQEIDLENDCKELIQLLKENHAFHHASIMSIVLRDYGQWSDPKIIQQRRSDIKWIMAVFDDYLEVLISEGIPKCMIRDDYVFMADKDETDDEVLEIPKSELLAKGFREIDIELQIATLRFDYDKVEDLLEQGADPEVYFGASTTAADFIHREIEHLSDELYGLISGQRKYLIPSDYMQIVGLGVHEKMWQLFIKYKRINSKRTSGNNYFLQDLCSTYQRYIDGVPDNFDDIEFTLDFPVVGWIDKHLYKNGSTVNHVELSSVCEPFKDMKYWIESMALGTKGKMMTTNLCIETEGAKQVFTFQPLWTYPYGKSKENTIYHEDTGIFTIYDEAEDRIIFEAYCETRQLIKKFYGALLNYAKSMTEKKEFINAWIWEAYNREMEDYDDDSPELQQLFLKKIQSPLLDELINDYAKETDKL